MITYAQHGVNAKRLKSSIGSSSLLKVYQKTKINFSRSYSSKSKNDRTSLSHIRVLDLSRVLAGPWATQHLADLGADVIKVEAPGVGDDTRAWGPPFLKNSKTGKDSMESAYFLGTNRGKKSITIDFRKKEGQELIRKLVMKSDVVVENYKLGSLKKYGLDYESLKQIKPDIIYASVTGYGSTGPRASQAGYDFAIQAGGGLMSITGESDGAPMKVGVAVTDIMTGMYASTGIMAALIFRDKTGLGQHVECSLFDTQLAFLANQGMNYLIGGKAPKKMGNQHPNIAPYRAFPAKDGFLVVTVGNDSQFKQFCSILGIPPEIAQSEKFATNSARVSNKIELYRLLDEKISLENRDHWLKLLAPTSIPHSPVNTIEEAFNDPQAKSTGSIVNLKHPLNEKCPVIASPLKLENSPVSYPRPAPMLGQHTDEVLKEIIHLDQSSIDELKKAGVL